MQLFKMDSSHAAGFVRDIKFWRDNKSGHNITDIFLGRGQIHPTDNHLYPVRHAISSLLRNIRADIKPSA